MATVYNQIVPTTSSNQVVVTFPTGNLRIDSVSVSATAIKVQRRLQRTEINELGNNSPTHVRRYDSYTCYAFIDGLPQEWQTLKDNNIAVGRVHIETPNGNHVLSGEVKFIDFDVSQNLLVLHSTHYR